MQRPATLFVRHPYLRAATYFRSVNFLCVHLVQVKNFPRAIDHHSCSRFAQIVCINVGLPGDIFSVIKYFNAHHGRAYGVQQFAFFLRVSNERNGILSWVS